MDVETITARINAWTQAERIVRRHFATRLGLSETKIDIQRAVMAVLDLEEPYSLLEREWTSKEIISLLEAVDFASWNGYEEIVLSSSILPVGIPRRLDEETIKFNGEIWRIYRYDPDPFPFLPHAHNLYEDIKLDLRDGRLYRKRELLGQLSRKELLAFRSRVKHIPLPALSD